MTQKYLRIAFAHLSWVAIGIGWYFATWNFHPNFILAVIVTSALMLASAVATDINHFVLRPRFRLDGRLSRYCWLLFLTLVSVTALALLVIRIAYRSQVGPDLDPYGLYKHFLIDLFGVLVHLGVATAAIKAFAGRTKASQV